MRRTRIKGVANIPQRKKTDLPLKSEEDVKKETEVPKSADSGNIELKEHAEDIRESMAVGKKIIEEEIIKTPVKLETESKQNPETFKLAPENLLKKELETATEPLISPKSPIAEKSVIIKEIISLPNNRFRVTPKINIIRNKVVHKPLECSKPVPNSIENQEDTHIRKAENNEGNTSDNVGDIKISESMKKDDEIESQKPLIIDKCEKEEFLQPPKSPLNSVIHSGKKGDIRRIASPYPSVGSDTEYPVPPASPNKLNRSRIKAIPRIGYRKISFSASESEDECKKVNHRTRNDSQSSCVSGVQEIVVENEKPKVKEFSSVIQRKCKRTEWSRKLAEARREFTRKFETGKPDHKKLTMMDLIFYNPTTNPMVKKEDKRTASESHSKEKDAINLSEEEDDPDAKGTAVEKSKSSDEENEMPAPQIKIGPAGEIILDEKSLVIENKQTKKNREEMQKSQVIDGNSDRPYGVVKRVKRSKDWSHSETLRFYKALSTIGTDFSLMCELFPNRTRRELKMKFKKEEKVNQALVDKAVMEPCGFDFAELKKEFELVEIELKELENQKLKDEKLRKNKEIKKSIKFLNMTQENNKSEPKEELSKEDKVSDSLCETNERVEETMQKNKRKRDTLKIRKRKLDIMSVLSDSDSNETDSEESEIIWRPTQTRYGRKVRKRQIYDPEPSLDEDLIIPRKILKPIEEKEPVQKPGSIMMIQSESTDGQPIVKIFMVTEKDGDSSLDTDNLLPIAMIKAGEKTENQEEIVENNYTIPAEPEENTVDS